VVASFQVTILVFILACATDSLAQTLVLKIKDASSEKPQETSSSDIDNKITDARMRAELGSKSKWSFKSRMNYTGGSVQGPFSKVTPNVRRSRQMESMSALSGDVGLNYRLSASDSVGAGVGVLMVAPLHGDWSQSVSDERNSRHDSQSRYQVSSPYASWNKGYLAWDTMMMTSVRYAHATDSDAVNLMKTFGKAFLFHQMNKNFGASRWNVGAGMIYMKSFYSGAVTDPKLKDTVQRMDSVIGITPFVQYAFNDRYSLRSEFGYFNFVRSENSNEFEQDEPFQSLGVGVSLTRDIFLFPSVQFAAKDIRGDRSNVALSANINLF
jgi:hypothetical protein